MRNKVVASPLYNEGQESRTIYPFTPPGESSGSGAPPPAKISQATPAPLAPQPLCILCILERGHAFMSHLRAWACLGRYSLDGADNSPGERPGGTVKFGLAWSARASEEGFGA
ncbi:hypothetical protein PtA15_15A35 [Puccinia triticina]|uniref:Uncharacterized protein n=1 Tax=Puccinia triticina TaxID=208348 RepID=A0ABY7D5N9_9BASI|nr:uncharacterized protein PtA15_15A35 [Puccinia triticina]WAQ91646.1 hypothetical protein PtA15_15A35 [Puccinia triticina]WAR62445.1 hypothetical protein PtB15_15B29 [Puccinia triticina]